MAVHPTQRAIYTDQAQSWGARKLRARDLEEAQFAQAAWDEWQFLWLAANGVRQEEGEEPEPEADGQGIAPEPEGPQTPPESLQETPPTKKGKRALEVVSA